MKRLYRVFGVIVLAALFFGTSWLRADSHHSESPSFKTVSLTEQIRMLQGRGGNLAVLTGDQGILLVDADYKVMSDALVRELNRYGGLDRLTYIINTHWHGDHTEGNMALGSSAMIVAHENVRNRLLTAQEIKLFKMVSEPYPEEALPEITYQQSMSLYINGEQVRLLHFPNGHTDGDTVVFFESSNVVHMGDHFFSGFFPFVDIDSGGNVLKMAANVKTVLSMIDDSTKVIPGHGPLSDKSGLEAFHQMLIGTAQEVKQMKEKGMGLQAIRQAGLSDRWEEWADGFLSTDVWIGIVYNSL